MSRVRPFPGTGAMRRGLRPPHGKHLAWESPIEPAPTPPSVLLPLLQHAGAPAKQALANPNAPVAAGDLIAEADGFVSASVHASVSGTAGEPSHVTLPTGPCVHAVPIESAADQPLSGQDLLVDMYGGDWDLGDPARHERAAIVQAARDAGLVGHGGAAFPTHVKLLRLPAHPVDTLLVNGCECEPYLTADYRLMLEYPRPILAGALLAARACGAERIFVAVEDDKPAAIEQLRLAARGTGIEIAPLQAKYPMGNERLAIRAVLGRIVPTGRLPLHVGVAVINVATAAALARALLRGKPVTHRIVTVSGPGVADPKNLLAPIGMSFRDLLTCCGGLADAAARVLAGGPMTGYAVANLDTPLTKGTTAVTALRAVDVRLAAQTACIRCGRCGEVCPTHLVPTAMAHAARAGNIELARRYHLGACLECGCCAYACPAGVPLIQWIREGKAGGSS